MAEKPEECKISLSPSTEDLDSLYVDVCYKLVTPNFFILPEYDGIFQLDSPPFHFADATCCFRFARDEEEDSTKEFAVYIVGLNSEITEQRILYQATLLDAYNKVYEDDAGYLEENEGLMWIRYFNNTKSCYDTRHTLTFFVHLLHVATTEVDRKQVSVSTGRDFYPDNMTEELKDCKISLSVATGNLDQLYVDITYNVKIPNFFLPENDDISELDSACFEFADVTWCFRFSRKEHSRIKKFKVYMVRLKSEIPEQRILYQITLLDAHNTVYKDCAGYCSFDENTENRLVTFDNEKPSYDERNRLTLIFRLFCAKDVEVDAGEILFSKYRGFKALSKNLKDMLLNGQDHNVTFNVQDKKFHAHQDMLRSSSEVFRSMLTHDMLEKKNREIDVPDIDPQAFEQLLCYIYTGTVDVLDESNMFGLYYAADKYNLAHLKEECREVIKKSLTVSNICHALELASRHSDASLLESSSNFFYKNVDDILVTVDWQLFMKENTTVANELFIKLMKILRVKKIFK